MSPVLVEPVLLSRQSRYVIGREEQSELRIKSTSVSRRHAEIHWAGEGFVLFDLGSTNGTHLNGWRIKLPCYLHNGDVIGVGTYEITVYVSAPGELPDEFGGATRPIRRRRPAS